MKPKQITVLVYDVTQDEPEVRQIPNHLDGLQAVVGGYVELVYVGDQRLDLYCHEEGKLENQCPNIFHPLGGDILHGTIFLSRGNPQTGEQVSLSSKDILDWTPRLIRLRAFANAFRTRWQLSNQGQPELTRIA